MYELDKVITDAEKEELVDTIIIKTQGFVNGNIKNGDKNLLTHSIICWHPTKE